MAILFMTVGGYFIILLILEFIISQLRYFKVK